MRAIATPAIPAREASLTSGKARLRSSTTGLPAPIRNYSDVKHDLGGYHSRAQIILARSFDGGGTWDRADDVVIFDERAPDRGAPRLCPAGASQIPP